MAKAASKPVQIELQRRFLAAAHVVCPTRDVRPALNGILVEADCDGTTLVATDGRRLLAVRDKAAALRGKKAVLRLWVGAEQLKAVVKAACEKVCVALDRGDDVARLVAGELEVEVASSTQVAQAFPQWRSILPREASGKAALLDGVLFKGLDKVQKLVAPAGHLGVLPNGPLPAFVTFGVPHAFAVLSVSTRGTAGFELPPWAVVAPGESEKQHAPGRTTGKAGQGESRPARKAAKD